MGSVFEFGHWAASHNSVPSCSKLSVVHANDSIRSTIAAESETRPEMAMIGQVGVNDGKRHECSAHAAVVSAHSLDGMGL